MRGLLMNVPHTPCSVCAGGRGSERCNGSLGGYPLSGAPRVSGNASEEAWCICPCLTNPEFADKCLTEKTLQAILFFQSWQGQSWDLIVLQEVFLHFLFDRRVYMDRSIQDMLFQLNASHLCTHLCCSLFARQTVANCNSTCSIVCKVKHSCWCHDFCSSDSSPGCGHTCTGDWQLSTLTYGYAELAQIVSYFRSHAHSCCKYGVPYSQSD